MSGNGGGGGGVKSGRNSTDFVDIERQIHREAEGQDTITPLTNSVFLRQLQKIRQNSKSNKSISSVGSSSRSLSNNKNSENNNRNSYLSDQTDAGDGDSQSLRSIAGSQIRGSDFESNNNNNQSSIPQSFLNLFRTPSGNSRSVRNNINLAASELDKFSLLNMTLSNNMINEDKQSRGSTLGGGGGGGGSATARASAHNLNHTRTDIVFDALSSIISHKIGGIGGVVGGGVGGGTQNSGMMDQRMSSKIQPTPAAGDYEKQALVEDIKLMVKQSEKIRKRRIDKSIFLCRAVTLFVFIFICVFILCFVQTILFIWKDFGPTEMLLENQVASDNNDSDHEQLLSSFLLSTTEIMNTTFNNSSVTSSSTSTNLFNNTTG